VLDNPSQLKPSDDQCVIRP